MTKIEPRTSVPDLEVQTLDDGVWRLGDQSPQTFTMIVFYRGLHCPVCKGYLRDLDSKVDEFAARGVDVIAISSDTGARSELAKAQWGLGKLRIGYGLRIKKAREWGLYVSKGMNKDEPAEFSEPGLFLVNPDRTLYAAAVNTMPFARPPLNEVLSAIDYVRKTGYPGRGEA